MAVWMVIGGAHGLPGCIAEAALERGHRVVVLGWDAAEAQETDDDRTLALTATRADPRSVDTAWQAACAWQGPPEVVVFAESAAVLGAVEEISGDDLEAMLLANVVNLHRVFGTTLPAFRHRRRGRYLVVGAARQLDTAASPATYGATMLAAEGLAEAVAAEAWDFGIRVTIVEPVGFSTHQLSGENVRLATGMVTEYEQSTAAARASVPEQPVQGCHEAAAEIVSLAENPRAPMRAQISPDDVRRSPKRLTHTGRHGRDRT